MSDRQFVKLMRLQARFIGLLLRYLFLRIRYVQLHIHYYLLKAVGAALIEAVKIETFIKTLSKEDRLALAALVVVSIFFLARIMLIRL